jgi:type II secretory pathway pseudopilin PulG
MSMSADRGYSLVELMVGTTLLLVVLGAILTVIQVSTRHQEFVATRVAVNQRARPVMTNIVNDLHSACIAPGIAPILPGSSGSTLSFISKSTEEVAPIPERHEVWLEGDALRESIFPVTPPTDNQPPFTFSGTPSSTRVLLTDVSEGAIGEPPQTVPVFQYFKYQGGQVSTTPIDTPLSSQDATQTVQVNVTFAAGPTSNPANDPKAPITLSDSGTLRLEPASEDVSEVNLPCV